MPVWLLLQARGAAKLFRSHHVAGLAGKDATEDFEEIGHSNSAKEMLTKYVIGSYEVRTGFGGSRFMANGDLGTCPCMRL